MVTQSGQLAEVRTGICDRETLRAVLLGEVVGTPVNLSFRSCKELAEFQEAKSLVTERKGSEYARYGTDAAVECEKKLARLEGAEDAVVFTDGMTAISKTIGALLERKGKNHCVIARECYRQTIKVLEHYQRIGAITDFTIVEESGDVQAFARAIRPETSFLFTESPTNPKLWLTDFKALADIARQHRVVSIIDSTLGAGNQTPILDGIDLVIHSLTKYHSGYNDLLGGAVIGRENYTSLIRQSRDSLGGVLDDDRAKRLAPRLDHLPDRVSFQNENALLVARLLELHPAIETVWYPGLPSHRDHELAKRQMPNGFGGLLTFELFGAREDAHAFLDALANQGILQAASLGGATTIIESVELMSYYGVDRSVLDAKNLTDRTIRLSCGIEHPDVLLPKFSAALDQVHGSLMRRGALPQSPQQRLLARLQEG